MAASEEMIPVVAGAGFPAVPVTDRTLSDFLYADRAGRPTDLPRDLDQQLSYSGGWWGRMAAASLDALLELSTHWRPDLVVGGAHCYAAALLAAHLHVPYVRHAWDGVDPAPVDHYANQELRPELERAGLERFPEPDSFIETLPQSVRPPLPGPVQPMRWVPGSRQRRLGPWIYARGERRRVCVTAGNRVSLTHSNDFLSSLVESIAALDVDVLVGVPEDAATELNRRVPDVHAGWLPLDVAAASCDLVVHHGGGVTSMTAFNAGKPQLCVPQWAIIADSVEVVAARGAGLTLPAGARHQDPQNHGYGPLGGRAPGVPQRRRRSPHPGRRLGAGRIRRDLRAQHPCLRSDPADQRHARTLRRRRGVLPRAHGLRVHGPQIELLARERQRTAFQEGLTCCRVDPQRAAHDTPGDGCRVGATQHNLYAGQQLRYAVRLVDAVVAAGLKPRYALQLGRPPGDGDDRNVRYGPDLHAELEAVEVGHVQFEQHQVRVTVLA